jgi:putative IMPACT (imprinted ancient) family translation regulator
MQVTFCYAYQIGIDTISYRANDDGEPSNSAGMLFTDKLRPFLSQNTCGGSQNFWRR